MKKPIFHQFIRRHRDQRKACPIPSFIISPKPANYTFYRELGRPVHYIGEITDSALHIALGNGRVLGYHVDAKGACVLQPVEYVAGWKALPA